MPRIIPNFAPKAAQQQAAQPVAVATAAPQTAIAVAPAQQATTSLILPPAPEWVSLGIDADGLDSVGEFVSTPRLHLLQPLSPEVVDGKYPVGTVVLRPQNVIVCPKDGAFYATPIFFWPEWIAWNPRAMRQQLPAIRERTTDPKSALAMRCRNSATWREPCPENPQQEIRNCEHLNAALIVYGVDELGFSPAVVSFSRASHAAGRKFATLIKTRRAAIYGGVYEFAVKQRANNQGSWFELAADNPSEASGVSPWVSNPNDYAALAGCHQQFASLFASGQISAVDDADADAEAAPAPAQQMNAAEQLVSGLGIG